MNLDQITWNMLFEWITGTRCFVPEGCPPPISGIVVYLLMLTPFIISFYLFCSRKLRPFIEEKVSEWRR